MYTYVQRSAAPLTFLLTFLFLFTFFAQTAQASFGITPPYVRNTTLTRNAVYEQQILLVRGDPTIPLRALITVDAPEVAGWVEVLEGTSVPLPRGEQKVPITVRVTVPSDAEFKEYRGAIRIKTVPDTEQVAPGAVSISLGAQVEIRLTVIDRKIEDFRIRKVSISDLNEGRKLGWLFFPGKIRFGMLVENTGNVDVAPSKVVFKIYDYGGNVLLEETANKGRVDKVAPYAVGDVMAELPTRLPAGSYLARFEIFNGEDVKHGGELNLSVLPYGTLQTAGFGFSGLSLAHKISVLLPIFAFIIGILYTIFTLRSRRQRREKG